MADLQDARLPGRAALDGQGGLELVFAARLGSATLAGGGALVVNAVKRGVT